MKKISRAEAKARGLKRYFTGKPCKYWHVCERYISGQCIECTYVNARMWAKNNPEKIIGMSKKQYWKNPERSRYLSRCRRDLNIESVRKYHAEWRKNNHKKVKASRDKFNMRQRAAYELVIELGLLKPESVR